jgi:hypothetical protein
MGNHVPHQILRIGTPKIVGLRAYLTVVGILPVLMLPPLLPITPTEITADEMYHMSSKWDKRKEYKKRDVDSRFV